MVGTLEQLGRLCDVESFLRFFEIEYEPGLVQRERSRILRFFAQETGEIDRRWPQLPEEERLETYRDALSRAYTLCTRQGCGNERWPFRVIEGGRAPSRDE